MSAAPPTRWIAALVLSACLTPQGAFGADAALHFPAADPAAIARWIGPPPIPESPQARRDVDELTRVQATRSAADCAFARTDAELSIFDPFVGVFGAAATAEAYPSTTRLIGALVEDTFVITAVAKAVYNRARPNVIDGRIRPCIDQPETSAYPSGHGVFMYTVAEAFSALVPERRDAIFARADVFAYNRIVGGIHFPTDATASRTAAALYYASASRDPAFAEMFAAARRELRTGLGLADAVTP
ncbi:phosphatase PAP2 family protein [Phenylobacterium sp.]|uniref:phosphatase PAP2 family protein n=1 Tax=Phenylobacterium sp. TaxID=1871053 RepID=UPI00286D647E|nr:phosphatase PAP2 family protein [Phenylobacterium sp.]